MLILARHGTTSLNQQGVLQGSADPPLADKGHRQAGHLSRYLSNLPVAVLLTSPSRRARETAQYCASELSLAARADDRFRERDFGAYEGLSRSELLAAREGAGLGLADPTQDWEGVDGVESDSAVSLRLIDGLRDAAAEHLVESVDFHVVVVTHAGMIKSVLHHLGFDARARHRAVKLAEGGIVRLIREHPGTLALHGLVQNDDMINLMEATTR